MHLNSVLNALHKIAPLEYAENWDNVGLLVGNRDRDISRVMTCLTLTGTTLKEAIEAGTELIICHHPIPFKPLPKITNDTTTGMLILQAIESGIAIYSPHTAWDNCKTGINQQLADILELEFVMPLQAFANEATQDESLGVGRFGKLPSSLSIGSLIERIRIAIPETCGRHTHRIEQSVSKVGIVCGSGGSMLPLVARRGCDAMLTGEATYHQCLEAESLGIAMILMGHHASESFSMKQLALQLQAVLPEIRVIASQLEKSLF